MPWDKLVKTHKDAITIAQILGFSHLWVDALCIAQDDDTEKAVEIGRMASIYANAYMTIAATGSSNSDRGVSRSRAKTLVINMTESDDSHSRLFARTTISHENFGYNLEGEMAQSISSAQPLFKRGWAFQERLLSPRILHFSEMELVWECLGMTSCECGTLESFRMSRIFLERQLLAGVPKDVELRCGKIERSRALAQRLRMLDTGESVPSCRVPLSIRYDYTALVAAYGLQNVMQITWNLDFQPPWRSLISRYSSTALKFESDRLLAVSGLALVWHARKGTPCRYLAGLWEDDILRELLWRCSGQTFDRPRQSFAPSWSWASVRSQVEWLEWASEATTYHVSVLDAECIAHDAVNLFGKVSEGYIRVRGT